MNIPIWNISERGDRMYGTLLKAFRKSAHISQEELAFQLHLNQSDVSKIENNTKEPVLSTVMQWVQLTGTQEAMAAVICGVDIATVLADFAPTVMTILHFW